MEEGFVRPGRVRRWTWVILMLGWMVPASAQTLEPSPGWPPVHKRLQETQAQIKKLKRFEERMEVVRGFLKEVEARAEKHQDPMVTLFWVYLDMVAATPSRAACKETERDIRFAAVSPTREQEGLPKSAAWALDLLHTLCR